MLESTTDAARVDALGDLFTEIVAELRHDGRITDEDADKLVTRWDEVALRGVF